MENVLMWKNILKRLTNKDTQPVPWETKNAKSIRTTSYNIDKNGHKRDFSTAIGEEYDPSKDAAYNTAVDSTAIQSARYDPSDNSLNIVYRGGSKEYKFSATPEEAQEWLNAPSKGRLTDEWKLTNRYPGY